MKKYMCVVLKNLIVLNKDSLKGRNSAFLYLSKISSSTCIYTVIAIFIFPVQHNRVPKIDFKFLILVHFSALSKDISSGQLSYLSCQVGQNVNSKQARSQGGVQEVQKDPPPHGHKVSKMVHNFGLILLVTIWNGI